MPTTPKPAKETSLTLRERKKRRTRQAIIHAGVALIRRVGYERATVADIAAAADISTRTFFAYFDAKDALLFPESDQRVGSVLAAIEQRGKDDGPVEVLLAALDLPGEAHDELVSETARLRLGLMASVPAVRGRALALQQEAVRTIATRLLVTFPDDLDEDTATALTGAYIGAVAGVLPVLLRDGPPTTPGEVAALRARLHSAVAAALSPSSPP